MTIVYNETPFRDFSGGFPSIVRHTHKRIIVTVTPIHFPEILARHRASLGMRALLLHTRRCLLPKDTNRITSLFAWFFLDGYCRPCEAQHTYSVPACVFTLCLTRRRT